MTAPSHALEPTLDVGAAARLARRSPETVRRWVWSGKLAASRHGRRLVFARDDLAALLITLGADTSPITLAECLLTHDVLVTADAGLRRLVADHRWVIGPDTYQR